MRPPLVEQSDRRSVCGEVLLLTLSAILACVAITAEVPLSGSPAEGDQGNFASIPKILVDSGFSRVILATWALWPALLVRPSPCCLI